MSDALRFFDRFEEYFADLSRDEIILVSAVVIQICMWVRNVWNIEDPYVAMVPNCTTVQTRQNKMENIE